MINDPDKSSAITVSVITTKDDLDAAFHIRRSVFVEEQGFELADEFDDDDTRSIHFLARVNDKPVGTARIIPEKDYVKIGRVAVLKPLRGNGHGLTIMEKCETEAFRLGYSKAVLHAQIQVQSFYERAGYQVEGNVFNECGWPHITMVKRLANGPSH